QRRGPLSRYPGRSSSRVWTVRWGTPRVAQNSAAAASSAAGTAGETAVSAATSLGPRARAAAASTTLESTPPEKATSVRPYPRSAPTSRSACDVGSKGQTPIERRDDDHGIGDPRAAGDHD